MRNYKLKDGYTLAQDIVGGGIVNLVVRKIDGSEADAIVGQIVDGCFIIPGADQELGTKAKLVYEADLDEFGLMPFASEADTPRGTDVDFDILGESELINYVVLNWADPLPDDDDYELLSVQDEPDEAEDGITEEISEESESVSE